MAAGPPEPTGGLGDEERHGTRRNGVGGTGPGASQVELVTARAARHLSRGWSGAEPGATREPGRATVPNGLWRPGRQATAPAALPSGLPGPVVAPCGTRAQLFRSHRWPGRIPRVCARGTGSVPAPLAPPAARSPVRSIISSALPIIPTHARKVERGVSLPPHPSGRPTPGQRSLGGRARLGCWDPPAEIPLTLPCN